MLKLVFPWQDFSADRCGGREISPNDVRGFRTLSSLGPNLQHIKPPEWLMGCAYFGCTLTHWGRDKIAAIFQTTFWNAFSWIIMYEFRLRFHWSLLLRVQLTIFQHWFRQWLGADQATSHCLDQWWLIYWRIYASLGHNELTHESVIWDKDGTQI